LTDDIIHSTLLKEHSLLEHSVCMWVYVFCTLLWPCWLQCSLIATPIFYYKVNHISDITLHRIKNYFCVFKIHAS